MIQRAYRLCCFILLLISANIYGQTAPTATLTAACTAPCNAPATITLSATTTVASGRAVSKVEFYDGPTLLVSDIASPYSTTRTGVVGGSHSFTAKVFDNAATPLTGTSAAKVIAVNLAPTSTLLASCNSNPCVAPATVTLTATPADADGTIVRVEFYRGTTLISTKTAAPWTFTDSALAAATYSYTANAFDNAATPLSVTSAVQSITVATAPTVTLTAVCTAPCNAPATITLSATTAVASGRAVSKVEFYEGTTLLAIDTTSPYGNARTSVTGGTHTYSAKVYDNATTPLNATSTVVNVTVNTAPTIILMATCSATPCSAPASVALTSTPADVDGSISKVEFYRGTTLITTKTAAPWTYSDSALAVGNYGYTAKAFDNAATPLATTSAAQAITVVAPVALPTVTLTAVCTAPCNAPAAITLTATTTIAFGRAVSKVEFYESATLLATDTTSPYSSTRTSVAGGTHAYTAKVYDNATTPVTATSTAINVTVNTAPTISLAAVCSASPCSAPATVTLTATPVDADGTISKVEFYRGATLLATKTAAPWTYVDATLAAGSYSYTAKAFDNGATPIAATSSTRTIAVSAATVRSVPIVIDGPSVSVDLPGSLPPQLTFTANAGDILNLRLMTDTSTGGNVVGELWPLDSEVHFGWGDATPAGTKLIWGSAYDDGYLSYVYQGGHAYDTLPLSLGGALIMQVIATGTYTVRFVNYGTTTQLLNFSLMRAAAPVQAQIDGGVFSANNSRPGQSVEFRFSSTGALPHAHQSVAPLPGWTSASGVGDQPFHTLVLSSSNRNIGAAFTTTQPDSYRVLVTPRYLHSGGIAFAVNTPQAGGTLPTNGTPSVWGPSRQIVDGVKYDFAGVAGKKYTIFLDKNGVDSPYRNFDFRLYGPDGLINTYDHFATSGPSAGPLSSLEFVATATGTYRMSFSESEYPSLGAPVKFFVAEDFTATTQFANPAATQLLLGRPYYNSVYPTSSLNWPVQTIEIDAIRTGTPLPDRLPVANCTSPFVGACEIAWPSFSRDDAYPIAYSLIATTTFVNGYRATGLLALQRAIAPPVATIEPPELSSGLSTTDDQISIAGSANLTVKNVSVHINGVPVPTNESGQYVVNNLSLSVGYNTVSVAAHTIDTPLPTPVNYTIVRSGASTPDFGVEIDRTSGHAPVTVQLRVINRTGAPWARVSIDATDDGFPDWGIAPTTESSVSTSVTYNTKGRHTIRVSVYGSTGVKLYETRRYVLVTTPADIAPIAREVYAGLQSKLSAGDTNGALTYVSDAALERFQSVFQVIGGANFAQYFSSLGAPALGIEREINVGARSAEMVVSRGTPGNERAYRVYFVKDTDGLWRIVEM